MIITRAEAREQGLQYYFTGVACKRGHVTYRHTRCATCSKCDEDRRLKPAYVKSNNKRQKCYKYFKKIQHLQTYYSFGNDPHYRKLFLIEHPKMRNAKYIAKWLGCDVTTVYQDLKELNIAASKKPRLI